MTDEQKAAMKKGREAYVEKQRQERESKAAQPVVKVEGDGNIPEPTLATANGHANLLDISEPSKWQMKIRMHLESLDAIRAEQWMDGYRLMGTVAGRMVRDQVYSRVTAYCFVCDKPLRDGGKPAGTAQYFDGDRQMVQVHCCVAAEYPQLLRKAQDKEDQYRATEAEAEKAARQALVALRQGNALRARA